MYTLRHVGCTIGEYVGDGRGEADTMAPSIVNPSSVVDSPMDADHVGEYQSAEGGGGVRMQ